MTSSLLESVLPAFAASPHRRRSRRGSRRDRGENQRQPTAPAPPDPTAAETVAAVASEPAASGTVTAEAQGPAGPKGATGPTGRTGATGADGPIATSFAAGAILLASTLFATAVVDAECPEGSEIVVGGFDTSVSGADTGEVKVNSAVAIEATGTTPARYRVTFTRTGTTLQSAIVVSAFAVCSP